MKEKFYEAEIQGLKFEFPTFDHAATFLKEWIDAIKKHDPNIKGAAYIRTRYRGPDGKN